MSRFEIRDKFYLDGEPIKIISGAFHYFRTVPEYWRDRLLKLKAMGGNTVETYIPWNMHEPKKGEFTFEGMLDIEKFIQTAQDIRIFDISGYAGGEEHTCQQGVPRNSRILPPQEG